MAAMLESYRLTTQCPNSLSSIISDRRKERAGHGYTRALMRRSLTSHTLRSTRERRDPGLSLGMTLLVVVQVPSWTYSRASVGPFPRIDSGGGDAGKVIFTASL